MRKYKVSEKEGYAYILNEKEYEDLDFNRKVVRDLRAGYIDMRKVCGDTHKRLNITVRY
jgi:hypothetical protein